MKRNYLFVVIMVIGFFSCSKKITRKTPESNVPKSELAQFVSMDDIANINIGMSFTNVKTILGIPFNIIMGQNDGVVIYQYKYRLINLQVPLRLSNNFGVEKGNTKFKYGPDLHDLYLMFNKDSRLEFIKSSLDDATEQMLRANNLLYVISKDKEKFANDESLEYRKVNGIYFDPLCINCSDNNSNAGMTSMNSVSQTKNTREDDAAKRALAEEEIMRKLAVIVKNWQSYNQKDKEILINIGPIENTRIFLNKLKTDTNLSNNISQNDKKLLNKSFAGIEKYLTLRSSLQKFKLF
jgi:hypothetical protein